MWVSINEFKMKFLHIINTHLQCHCYIGNRGKESARNTWHVTIPESSGGQPNWTQWGTTQRTAGSEIRSYKGTCRPTETASKGEGKHVVAYFKINTNLSFITHCVREDTILLHCQHPVCSIYSVTLLFILNHVIATDHPHAGNSYHAVQM